MSTAIYILSCEVRSNNNEYKIGIHTGSLNKLKSRYNTYFINLKIYYFEYVENATLCENIMKTKLKKNRIKNDNDKLSEWVRMDINDLMKIVHRIVKKNGDVIDNKIKIVNKIIIKKKDYCCKNCKKYFSRKYSLTRHLENNKCTYTCEICDKIYKSRDGLYKHKKDYHPELIKTRKSKKMPQKNNKIINSNNCNNIMINSNNCNNIMINPENKINIVDFGKEDIDIFSNKEIKRMLLSTQENIITKLILFINFNKKYPQYHNCYYPSENKNSIFIFVNQGWEQTTLADVSERIVTNRRINYNKMVNKINYITEEEKKNNNDMLFDMTKQKNINYTKSTIKKILVTYHPIIKDVYERTKHCLPRYDFFDVSDDSSDETVSEEIIKEKSIKQDVSEED